MLPFGSWPSPITADLVVEDAVRLSEVRTDGADVYWDESRPAEGGRVVVVRRTPDGQVADRIPAGFSARTRVHEYGGGAWWLHSGTLFFANWDDQRLYRLDEGGDPLPLTRDPIAPHALRYADGRLTPDGGWIICVRESHEAGGEPVNEIVALPSEGGDCRPLVSGADFVSNPRISPDGSALCWLQWNHPSMPWEAAELWVAPLSAGGAGVEVGEASHVAGGSGESVVQPEWDPEGTLHFLSDRTGWWTLYRCGQEGVPPPGDAGECLWDVEREIGMPQWVFGASRYALRGGGEILAAAAAHGSDGLWLLGPGREPGGNLVAEPVPAGVTSVTCLSGSPAGAVIIGASFRGEPAVMELRAAEVREHLPAVRVLRPTRALGVDEGWFSTPEHVTFPTGDGSQVAHALFYRPAAPGISGPAGERPPLLVQIHGGPTAAARSQLQLGIQFWTSRGFAVADVNYRGSTGYGRAYRELLNGAWGVADVEDCIAVARYLSAEGEVDPCRMAIHGGSAGGYTTLCALASGDAFTAGASSYGVADLEALARETHKFESRYLDSLVGPYPERRELYQERSPIHRVDRIDAPLLVMQGLEDEVVPPNQSEMIVDALRSRGVPVAYLTFEGEQHGFRRAETIRRALGAELAFYARIFGFLPEGGVEPLEIENLQGGSDACGR